MKRILAIISMLCLLAVCMAPGLPLKVGDTYSTTFILSDTAGVATFPSATPAVEVYLNSTATTGWTVVCGTADATKPGRMKLTGTALPTTPTGSVISLGVSATVAGVTSSKIVDEFQVVGQPLTFGTGDGQVNARSGMVQTGSFNTMAITNTPVVNAGLWGGTALPTAFAVTGTPYANTVQWGSTTLPTIGTSILTYADLMELAGSKAFTVTGTPYVNSVQWGGAALPTAFTVTGTPYATVAAYGAGTTPIQAGTGAGQINVQGGMVNTGSIYNVQQTGTDLYTQIAGISTAVQLGVASTLLANGTTVTTGSNISGTYGSTWYSNNQYWVTAPVAEGLDAYLTYTASANQYINSVTVRGYFNAAPTRYLDISASNCQGTGWDQLSDATTRMNNASTNQNYTYPLSSRNQGPNGEVRLRFSSTSSTLTDRLWIDQAIVGIGTAGPSSADIATAVYNRLLSVVYEGGITIDTESGTDGTVLGTNGTIINPVKTYSSACTLAANLGVKRFYLKPDSLITLTQNHDNWRFIGKGKIDLGTQSVNDVRIEGAELVYGTGTGDDVDIHESVIGNLTLSAPAYFERCAFTGSVSLASSGNFTFHNCYDANPGVGDTPCLVFTNSTASAGFRTYSGGIDLALMTSGNAFKADGRMRINVQNGCTGGDVTVRGFAPALTGTAATLLTVTEGSRYGTDQLVTPGTGTGQLNVQGGMVQTGSFNTLAITNTPNVNAVQLGSSSISTSVPMVGAKMLGEASSNVVYQTTPQYRLAKFLGAAVLMTDGDYQGTTLYQSGVYLGIPTFTSRAPDEIITLYRSAADWLICTGTAVGGTLIYGPGVSTGDVDNPLTTYPGVGSQSGNTGTVYFGCWGTYSNNAAIAGDAMNLTSAYEAAKTAASQSSVNSLGTPQQSGSAVTLPTIPDNWITAAGIDAGALSGKGDWITSGTGTGQISLSSGSVGVASWGGTAASSFPITSGTEAGQLDVLGGTLAGGVNLTQLGGTLVSSMLSEGLLKVAADTISGKALQFDTNDVPYVSVYSWGAAGNLVNDNYVLTVTDIQTIAQHQTKSGGRVWYVSPAGAGAGSTLGDPGSLAVAATACSSGDTIFLTAGTYTTTLSISGKANLDIRGAGAGATVVTATCATTGWEFTNCPDIRVSDVSLTFSDPVIGERPVVTALGFVNCDRLTLEACANYE